MEFFEKAHISKSNAVKKDSKSEEMVKKQLKQMLHGYKLSDNELIKSSGNTHRDIAEVHKALDDSVSVSGFSDLDITQSEDEEETIPITSFGVGDEDISGTSQINLHSTSSQEQTEDANSEDTTNRTERSGEYLEPISEGDEDVESLPEDLELTENASTSGDTSFSEFAESSFDESGSEEFDPDGSLASKIMQNLSKIKSGTNVKKRKLEELPVSIKEKCKEKKTKSKTLNKSRIKYINDIELEHLNIHDNDEDFLEKFMENNTQDSVTTNSSSPFISITATEMADHSLSEILGGYNYPTVRNLPYEKQTLSANSTSIFSTDDNMQVDDVDSLVPEIGEDPIIEDIEIELDVTADSELQSTEIQDIETKAPQKSVEKLSNESRKSKYVHPVRVYYTETHCIFVLQHPAELFINGKAKVKVLGGKVEVFGHTLKQEVNLYSPNNSFAHCLKTKVADNEYYGLFGQLTGCGLSVRETEEIVTSLGEYDAVIVMSPLKDPKMAFVDNHFHADVFNRLKIDTNAHRLSKASDRLSCNVYLSKPLRSFENYISWEEDLSCTMKKSSRGIVCGGKGLGKSTLIRYYINQMLENGPILMIDLDPGQAEFTVAGNISATVVTTPLLGPNYTHLKTPDICYNIGMINVMDNTLRFASTVTKLIEQCRNKYHSMPWIINTMGMTTYMGLKLIVLTIIHSQPTFLIQIDSKVVKKRFECSLEPQAIRMVYENCKYDRLYRGVEFPEDLDYKFVITSYVEGSYKHDTSLSPRDERYLNFLAYFGELVAANDEENILGIVPYEMDLSDLNIVSNVKVAKDSVLQVINGKIVALCQLNTTDKGKVFTLQDNALLCYGNGLIRGVDFNNNLVYLVTPVPVERLSAVNAIVYCDWTPELLGTERFLPAGLTIPYRTAAYYRNKQHMIAPRRRFNPLQLLKMSRSS